MLFRMPDAPFDEWTAQRYETLCPELFDPAVVDPAVSFLAEVAGTRPALELGIGTGRIAMPLSRRGVRVHGIELSHAMVAHLQAQQGASEIGVTIGDFATAIVGGMFTVVCLLRNTITNLTTQDEQVECFLNAVAHVEPGGCFVIENYVPELQRLPPGETIHVFATTPAHLGFEEYDVAARVAVSHHHWVIDGPTQDLLVAAPLCMARRAGPHGTIRRNDPARAVEQLEPRALHEREPQPYFGLGDARRG